MPPRRKAICALPVGSCANARSTGSGEARTTSAGASEVRLGKRRVTFYRTRLDMNARSLYR